MQSVAPFVISKLNTKKAQIACRSVDKFTINESKLAARHSASHQTPVTAGRFPVPTPQYDRS